MFSQALKILQKGLLLIDVAAMLAEEPSRMTMYIYICLFVSLYLYVPDEGSLLPKYRDCTTSNDFELYIYIYVRNS